MRLGLPSHRTSLPSHRSASRYSASASAIGPNRSGPRLAQPMRPMLSLSLNTPPQAQLEALQSLRAHGSGSSCLHASLALLDLFDSARFDPSGRLVCSHGPCQLSCCRGVGASPTAFSSACSRLRFLLASRLDRAPRPVRFRALRPFWSASLLTRPLSALRLSRCWRFSCCLLFRLGLG